MKLRSDQLGKQLERGLAALYLVFGDEPLQIQESCDAIRAAARRSGCDEREVLTVEIGFDWSAFATTLASRSLFSARRLIELRLEDAKPGDAGGKALVRYAAAPDPDIVLLISAGRLDAGTQKTRWFNALDAAGVVIQTRQLEPRQLSIWIEQRLRQRGLQASGDAVALLIERVEGNLLAAAQEIDKLALLHSGTTLDVDTLLDTLGHQARYTVFDLVDTALEGDVARVLRIVRTLQEEAAEPTLIAWALAREVQLLGRLHEDLATGGSIGNAFNQHKVWEKRKPLLAKALRRLNSNTCRDLLIGCAALDRCIKGIGKDDPWMLLQRLILTLAGRQPLPLSATND